MMNESAKQMVETTKAINVAFKGYKDGSVEFFGDQVNNLTGYSKDEFNSKRIKWTDVVLEEDREKTTKAFKQALKTDKTYVREYRIKSKTGDLRWMQDWGQIICDENGEIEYVTGILVDITERKLIEEARLKSERLTGKYLTFTVAEEEFGIGILHVKEIMGMMPVTSVPQTPDHVKGVINLRGKIIPVIDLRLRFALEEIDYTDRTCIIVVEVPGREGLLLVGIVVDSVSEVLNLRGDDIEDRPSFGTKVDMDYILGIAKMDGGVKILLDIDKVLTVENLRDLSQVA